MAAKKKANSPTVKVTGPSENDKYLDKKYGKSPSTLVGQVGRYQDNAYNNLNHGAHQIGDFLQGLSGWLGVPSILAGPLRSVGFRNQNPTSKTVANPKYQPPVKKQTSPTGGGYNDPGLPAKTLADYMAQARAMGIGGGDGTNYDALINQIRANGATGDAKLQAMYQQLANANAGDAPGIARNFDTTGSKIAASSDQAAADTAQAYNQTRQAQTQQLADLGIGNAAAVLAANGGQAARDQNIALGNIAQNKAADVNLNTAHAANAQQYNTGVVESNRTAGVEARSSLQQQLANKIAELESAKASSATNGASQAFEAAQVLQRQDPLAPGNIAAAQRDQVTQDLANQYKASQIALNRAKTQGSARTIQDALAASVDSQNKLHKLYLDSGGSDNVDDFTKWLKAVQLSGSIAR